MLLAAPAVAVVTEFSCGNALGYDIRFSHEMGVIPPISGDRCSDTFQCARAESVGPFLQKIDSGVTPRQAPASFAWSSP